MYSPLANACSSHCFHTVNAIYNIIHYRYLKSTFKHLALKPKNQEIQGMEHITVLKLARLLYTNKINDLSLLKFVSYDLTLPTDGSVKLGKPDYFFAGE